MYLKHSSPSKPIVYPEDIQCIVDPISGKGGIYIGNLEASQNAATLKSKFVCNNPTPTPIIEHGIRAVLTAASGACLNHSKADVPFYKYIPGQDHERFDISKYFEECILFIHNALQETNILVHCMAGISRSVTLVLAYFIKCRGMTYDSAYTLVKGRRKIIHPNDGFIEQLKRFQQEVRKSQSPTRPVSSYESPSKRALYQSPYRHESPSKKYHQIGLTNNYSEEYLRNTYCLERQPRYESPSKRYESPLKRYQSPLKNGENRVNSYLMQEDNRSRHFEARLNQNSPLLEKQSVAPSTHLHYRGKSEIGGRNVTSPIANPEDDINKKIADIRRKYADLSDHLKSKRGNYEDETYRPQLRQMKSMYDQNHVDVSGQVSGDYGRGTGLVRKQTMYEKVGNYDYRY